MDNKKRTALLVVNKLIALAINQTKKNNKKKLAQWVERSFNILYVY